MEKVKTLRMELPPLPVTKGRRGTNIDPVTKDKIHFRILDEVVHIQSDCPTKAIYLQKVEFEEDKRVELRLGYYIIGKKPGMLGKWVWGQYATFMPVGDFAEVVKKAEAKGWFQAASAIERAG